MLKKEGRYQRIVLQLEALLKKSDDPTAQMATISAVLYNKMDDFFWCGFYRIVNGDLVVGPYQGPVACQVLQRDKGVCWAGIHKNSTVVVPNVHEFPDHIACDSRSNSEIAVPVRNRVGRAVAILDLDSKNFNTFDQIDTKYLEKIVTLINF